MGDEEFFVIVDTVVPVMEILGEINLLGGPERRLGLLVHLPDLKGWCVSKGRRFEKSIYAWKDAT